MVEKVRGQKLELDSDFLTVPGGESVREGARVPIDDVLVPKAGDEHAEEDKYLVLVCWLVKQPPETALAHALTVSGVLFLPTAGIERQRQSFPCD